MTVPFTCALLFKVAKPPLHPLYSLLFKVDNSHDLKTNKKPWWFRGTNERYTVHPKVFSKRTICLSVSWLLRPCLVWSTYHSSLISQGVLGSVGSSLQELLQFLTISRIPPAEVIPFARHTLTHQPSHWDLKFHFLVVAFPQVPVNTCFQRTVFMLHKTYFRETLLHLCDYLINATLPY